MNYWLGSRMGEIMLNHRPQLIVLMMIGLATMVSFSSRNHNKEEDGGRRLSMFRPLSSSSPSQFSRLLRLGTGANNAMGQVKDITSDSSLPLMGTWAHGVSDPMSLLPSNVPSVTTSHSCLLPQDDLIQAQNESMNMGCYEWRQIQGVEGWALKPTEAKDLQKLFFDPAKLSQAGDEEGWVWMAADVSGSLPFTKDRYLWLFGDTLIGKGVTPETWDGENYNTPTLPRQTIAFANMKSGELPLSSSSSPVFEPLNFFMRKDAKAKPGDVNVLSMMYPDDEVIPDTEDETVRHFWYWILTGLRPALGVAGDSTSPLFLLCAMLGSGGPSGWGDVGSVMFRVRNPEDDPKAWIYNEKLIPGTNEKITWSASMVEHPDDGYVYIWGLNSTAMDQTLSRVPLDDLVGDDFSFSRMQVWAYTLGTEEEEPNKNKMAPTPGWVSNELFLHHSSSYRLAPVLTPATGFSELSVVWNQVMNRWVIATLFYSEAMIALWVSEKMEGPWIRTDALDIRAYETKTRNNPSKTRFVYYAAKIHPELTPTGAEETELVLTYNGNTAGVWPAPTEYTPRFFRLTLQKETPLN